jgi:hypothetical protein
MAQAKVAVYLRINPNLYEKLKKLADKTTPGLSVSAFVIKLITAYAASKEEKHELDNTNGI